MKLYILGIINVIILFLPVYISLRQNTPKHGFFYAVVFTVLIMGIIANLPYALDFWLETSVEIHKKIMDLASTFMAIFVLPSFIAAVYPILHFIPFGLFLILVAAKAKTLTKKQISILALLNVLYGFTAYASVRAFASLFCQ